MYHLDPLSHNFQEKKHKHTQTIKFYVYIFIFASCLVHSRRELALARPRSRRASPKPNAFPWPRLHPRDANWEWFDGNIWKNPGWESSLGPHVAMHSVRIWIWWDEWDEWDEWIVPLLLTLIGDHTGWSLWTWYHCCSRYTRYALWYHETIGGCELFECWSENLCSNRGPSSKAVCVYLQKCCNLIVATWYNFYIPTRNVLDQAFTFTIFHLLELPIACSAMFTSKIRSSGCSSPSVCSGRFLNRTPKVGPLDVDPPTPSAVASAASSEGPELDVDVASEPSGSMSMAWQRTHFPATSKVSVPPTWRGRTSLEYQDLSIRFYNIHQYPSISINLL